MINIFNITNFKVNSKFVINRNNTQYFYTESGIDRLNGPQYNVYIGHSKLAYTPENFYAVFGTDPKLSIENFIKMAEQDIIVSDAYNEDGKTVITNLDGVTQRIQGKDSKNPPITGYRDTLVTAIERYNSILKERELENTRDFIEENDLLKKLQENEKANQRVRGQDIAA